MHIPAEQDVAADQRELWQVDRAELFGDQRRIDAISYRARMDPVLDLVRRLHPSGLVYDVACCQGNFALQLATPKRHVVGIDLQAHFLQYARQKTDGENTSWCVGHTAHLPVRSNTGDVVILAEVIEHVAYPERLLSEGARVCRPGGTVIVTTPNGDWLRIRVPCLSEIRDRRSIEEIADHHTRHLFGITPAELRLMGVGAGLVETEHRFVKSPAITGWPRWQRVAERLPLGGRLAAERAITHRRWLARRICEGHLAVFTKA